MIPDVLIILFTILDSIKIKGYHQFARKMDKCLMQVASFKTNSKTHNRIKSKYILLLISFLQNSRPYEH